MKVIDLTDEYKALYFVCLEDWSEDMKEAGSHKEVWYNKMKSKDLRVKLARDDYGMLGGMIQYMPIEHAFAQGKGLYFIHCIWIHKYKKGGINFRKKGMGKALLQAAEDDAQERGAQGMVAWGISMPFWMKASWFKKHGYQKADRVGMRLLLWKPFTAEAAAPRWIRERKKPQASPGKVTVTSFRNGWCPAQNIVFERAKRASLEFGDKVEFREIETLDRDNFLEWGISDALFINNKQVRTGPPPSFEAIKKKIARKVRKL
jgi:GNAT superfamily N-acetyltransferase